MATTTTHYGLTKPAYSESADVATINDNMDSIDAQMYKNESGNTGIENGIAIVSVGDTHGAITSGQYVYVKDHSTLPEGMYTASSNIAANGALSTTNLTAVSSGALNALSEQIATVNSNLTTLNNYVKANSYNTPVDITGYTSATRYIAPKDGYVHLVNGNGQTAMGFVYPTSAGGSNINIGGVPGRFGLFVRKGMEISFSGSATAFVFYPIG